MSVEEGLLGLGSNVGERRAHLQAAVDALPTVGVEVTGCSSVYDTDPVGEVLDQPSFLNACVAIRTSLEPLQLLDALKALEAHLGREAGIRHGPRAIDIDILLLGAISSNTSGWSFPTNSSSTGASSSSPRWSSISSSATRREHDCRMLSPRSG